MNKKNLIIIGAIVLILVVAGGVFFWQSNSTANQDGAPPVTQVTSVSQVIGNWQTRLPGSNGEHVLTFEFANNQQVKFTQEYPDGTTEPTVNPGTWELQPDGLILAQFATESMVFELKGNFLSLLSFDKNIWGEQGFTLERLQ